MDTDLPSTLLEAAEKIDPATLLQNKYVSEETFKRISSHKGIVGMILTDSLGIALKSSMSWKTTTQYAKYVSLIVLKAKNVTRVLEPSAGMTLLRVRTKMHELIVVPSDDYLVIIVQKASADHLRH